MEQATTAELQKCTTHCKMASAHHVIVDTRHQTLLPDGCVCDSLLLRSIGKASKPHMPTMYHWHQVCSCMVPSTPNMGPVHADGSPTASLDYHSMKYSTGVVQNRLACNPDLLNNSQSVRRTACQGLQRGQALARKVHQVQAQPSNPCRPRAFSPNGRAPGSWRPWHPVASSSA